MKFQDSDKMDSSFYRIVLVFCFMLID